VVDFPFAIIELFSLALMIETLWANIGRDRRFSEGWVTLSANFRWKRTSPPTIVGIRKLDWFCYLIVKTAWSSVRLDRVPACDGRRDGRTDRRNCCRYYSALHCKQCGRAVKMVRHTMSTCDAPRDEVRRKSWEFCLFVSLSVCLYVCMSQFSAFLPREAAMLARSWGIVILSFCLSVCPSLCLSVRHKRAL